MTARGIYTLNIAMHSAKAWSIMFRVASDFAFSQCFTWVVALASPYDLLKASE